MRLLSTAFGREQVLEAVDHHTPDDHGTALGVHAGRRGRQGCYLRAPAYWRTQSRLPLYEYLRSTRLPAPDVVVAWPATHRRAQGHTTTSRAGRRGARRRPTGVPSGRSCRDAAMSVSPSASRPVPARERRPSGSRRQAGGAPSPAWWCTRPSRGSNSPESGYAGGAASPAPRVARMSTARTATTAGRKLRFPLPGRPSADSARHDSTGALHRKFDSGRRTGGQPAAPTTGMRAVSRSSIRRRDPGHSTFPAGTREGHLRTPSTHRSTGFTAPSCDYRMCPSVNVPRRRRSISAWR